MARKNRSRQDIIRDVLAFLAIGPNRKTIIAGKVNTNHYAIEKVLKTLHTGGFVKPEYLGNQRAGYEWSITSKGHKLLDRLNAVEEMLREVA